MNDEQSRLLERITRAPDILAGKLTIRQTRFPLNDVLELLTSGLSEKDILEQHPILEKEDIQAVLLYAQGVRNKKEIFIIPEHMKKGIRQGEEDIKNGDFITMDEFQKRYEKWLKD